MKGRMPRMAAQAFQVAIERRFGVAFGLQRNRGVVAFLGIAECGKGTGRGRHGLIGLLTRDGRDYGFARLMAFAARQATQELREKSGEHEGGLLAGAPSEGRSVRVSGTHGRTGPSAGRGVARVQAPAPTRGRLLRDARSRSAAVEASRP